MGRVLSAELIQAENMFSSKFAINMVTVTVLFFATQEFGQLGQAISGARMSSSVTKCGLNHTDELAITFGKLMALWGLVDAVELEIVGNLPQISVQSNILRGYKQAISQDLVKSCSQIKPTISTRLSSIPRVTISYSEISEKIGIANLQMFGNLTLARYPKQVVSLGLELLKYDQESRVVLSTINNRRFQGGVPLKGVVNFFFRSTNFIPLLPPIDLLDIPTSTPYLFEWRTTFDDTEVEMDNIIQKENFMVVTLKCMNTFKMEAILHENCGKFISSNTMQLLGISQIK